VATQLLHYFVAEAVEIYGAEIAALKMHELLHVPEDYLRFGPLDAFSAFRFECFLGKMKKLVKGHQNLETQVINRYSSLLQSGSFSRGGDHNIDSLEEYFEVPQLQYPYTSEVVRGEAFFRCGRTGAEHPQFDACYKRLYTKSFCIRVDNDGDSCCVVNGDVFLKVREILQCTLHNEERIYLCGNTFTILHALYHVHVPSNDDTDEDTTYSSADVGQVVGRLTEDNFICEFSAISQKVCAIPLMEGDVVEAPVVSDLYVLSRFLH